MFEKLLFPVNESREAIKTAAKAVELAQKNGSQMIVLTVSNPDQPTMFKTDSLHALQDQVKAKIEQAGIPCESVRREGKSAFVICDVADELNVDLIVIGAQGVGLREDIQSIAAQVIQFAPCPVLVVP